MSCKIAVGCTEFTIISSFPTSVIELKTIVLSNTKNWIKKNSHDKIVSFRVWTDYRDWVWIYTVSREPSRLPVIQYPQFGI